MHLHLHTIKKGLCYAFLLLITSTSIYAQDSGSLSSKYPKNSKVLYNTIEVKDEIGKVVVYLDDSQDFKYDYWEGDVILVEQEIHFENTPRGVFNDLIKRKRYALSEDLGSNTLSLKYVNSNIKKLKINYKDMNEKVYIKLLVPEKINVELKQRT